MLSCNITNMRSILKIHVLGRKLETFYFTVVDKHGLDLKTRGRVGAAVPRTSKEGERLALVDSLKLNSKIS